MDNEITSFDEYLKKYNLPKKEPENKLDLIYESEVEDLQDEIEEIEEIFPQEEQHFEQYRVRVKTGRLRYFSGPGTNYVEFGTAKRGDEFTIIAEEPGLGALRWGQTENDGSWIPLDYCERIGES